ncbi:serine hydrolase domain-containing protein [Gemmatimonadota bacterium]
MARCVPWPVSALLLGLVVSTWACDGDPIQTRFPETQGIDPAALDSVYAVARDFPWMFSLLVQRNGIPVAEEYFHGFTPDSLHDVRSVTKSVISILTGIAVEQGFIAGIDEPVGTYLRPVVDSLPDEKAAIPIRYFLMMSSGLDWHELDRGSSYSEWWQSDDMIQFVVDLPMVHAPGERFIYNTGASHLLSVILTEATGMPTLDFALEYLFGPMAVSDASWLQENRGYFTGGMGLRITARAMMKIGQMFLDGGLYEGTRVLPEDWITQSTAPLITTDNVIPFGPDYGYLWWVGSGGGRDFYLASGYGGQFILVDPDLDLVLVTQGDWRGKGWDLAGEQWYRVLELLVNGLLPSVE